MKKGIAVVLASSLLAVAFTALSTPKAGAATTTLSPVADTYVQSDQPTANFGTATSIKVDGSPATVSYLRFDVAGLSGAPTKATLKVFKSLSTTTAITLKPVADNTWTETGLTYNTKPAVGTTTITPPTPWGTDVWLSYDVTALVTGNGLVSFALDTTSSTSKSLPSREASTNQPQLILETNSPSPSPSPSQTPTDSTVVAVGGDVACGTTEADYNGGAGTDTACHMKQTSDLVLAMAPQRVFALGDLQYNSGALSDFNVSYNNSWGRFKGSTNPVVGNHEYGTSNAGGYFTYFGSAAAPSLGYYSFNVTVGTSKWHVVVINSECTRIGGGVGCADGSPQYNWLASDLTANDNTTCTAVLTHRPRWSSNSFASPDIQPLVDLMGAHHVDLLLTGHAHSYERFAPQNAAGQATSDGIREIIVGTGGRDSQGFGTVVANSLVRKNHIFGVMKLTLHPTGYDWAFVPDPATPFNDSGSGNCN
jgi:hypothetical protein